MRLGGGCVPVGRGCSSYLCIDDMDPCVSSRGRRTPSHVLKNGLCVLCGMEPEVNEWSRCLKEWAMRVFISRHFV